MQDRIQRCVQRCQDKAQEQLPSQPSPKDIEKAQALLANCAADCAQVSDREGSAWVLVLPAAVAKGQARGGSWPSLTSLPLHPTPLLAGV